MSIVFLLEQIAGLHRQKMSCCLTKSFTNSNIKNAVRKISYSEILKEAERRLFDITLPLSSATFTRPIFLLNNKRSRSPDFFIRNSDSVTYSCNPPLMKSKFNSVLSRLLPSHTPVKVWAIDYKRAMLINGMFVCVCMKFLSIVIGVGYWTYSIINNFRAIGIKVRLVISF